MTARIVSTYNRSCDVCGSEYRIREIKLAMRDKDSLKCDVCETELFCWNGGVMFIAELISRGTKQKQEKT